MSFSIGTAERTRWSTTFCVRWLNQLKHQTCAGAVGASRYPRRILGISNIRILIELSMIALDSDAALSNDCGEMQIVLRLKCCMGAPRGKNVSYLPRSARVGSVGRRRWPDWRGIELQPH